MGNNIDLFHVIIRLSGFITNAELPPQVNNFRLILKSVVDGYFTRFGELINKLDFLYILFEL